MRAIAQGRRRLIMAGEFQFEVPLVKAYRGEGGEMMVEGVASSTALDRQRERMTLAALSKMTHYQGIDLLPGHGAGPLEVLGTVEDVWLDDDQCRIVGKLDDEYPPAERLFKRLEEGKDFGLSVGGKVIAAHWERDDKLGKQIRVIDDVHLDHVAVCRATAAANPHTYLAVLAKTIEPMLEEEDDMSDEVVLSEEAQKGLVQRIVEGIGGILRKSEDTETEPESDDDNPITRAEFNEAMKGVEDGMAELVAAQAEPEGVEEPEEAAEGEPEANPAVVAEAVEPAETPAAEELETADALKKDIAERIAASDLPEDDQVKLLKSYTEQIDRMNKSIEELDESLAEHNRTEHAGKSAALPSADELHKENGNDVDWESIV